MSDNELVRVEDEAAKKSQALREIEVHLVDSLRLFCESQGIPHLSADELLCEELTEDQRRWVQAFYDMWMANEAFTY